MYQSNRGDYRTRESLFSSFMNSCLGRIITLVVIMAILALIAYITCPTEQYVKEEMEDNIRQCIENNDGKKMDGIDNALANVGYMFSSAEGEPNQELKTTFERHNRTECYDHSTYRTFYVYNSYHAEGVRCGVGIFGMVIPTLNYADLLMQLEPIRKEYPKKEIPLHQEGDSLYFGDTPDLIFRSEFD